MKVVSSVLLVSLFTVALSGSGRRKKRGKSGRTWTTDAPATTSLDLEELCDCDLTTSASPCFPESDIDTGFLSSDCITSTAEGSTTTWSRGGNGGGKRRGGKSKSSKRSGGSKSSGGRSKSSSGKRGRGRRLGGYYKKSRRGKNKKSKTTTTFDITDICEDYCDSLTDVSTTEAASSTPETSVTQTTTDEATSSTATDDTTTTDSLIIIDPTTTDPFDGDGAKNNEFNDLDIDEYDEPNNMVKYFYHNPMGYILVIALPTIFLFLLITAYCLYKRKKEYSEIKADDVIQPEYVTKSGHEKVSTVEIET